MTVAEVSVSESYLAFGGGVELEQQFHQRGLAASALTYYGGGLSCGYGEGHVLQCRLTYASGVAEGEVGDCKRLTIDN